MRITPCGAVGGVTGSGYLIEITEAKVLVDLGMFQGPEGKADRNRNLCPVEPRKLDAAVLTHAHLDHCGRLPLLAVKPPAGSWSPGSEAEMGLPRRHEARAPGASSRSTVSVR